MISRHFASVLFFLVTAAQLRAADQADLVSALESENPAGRILAIQALEKRGWKGADAALPHLVACLGDSDPRVREEVFRVIPGIGYPLYPFLVAGLEDSSPVMRRECVFALRNFISKTGSAEPGLLRACGDADPEVRRRSFQVLGNHLNRGIKKSEALVSLFMGARKDPDWMVRQRVVPGILASDFEPVSLLSILTEGLKDENVYVRSEYVGALGSLGQVAEPAVPAILAHLADETKGWKTPVFRALGEIGPGAGAAVPILQKYAEDPDAHFAEVALNGLLAIGDRSKATLERTLRCLARAIENSSLPGNFHLYFGPETLPALIILLDDPMERARFNAATAISGFNRSGAGARFKLKKLWEKDPSEKVREAAGSALSWVDPGWEKGRGESPEKSARNAAGASVPNAAKNRGGQEMGLPPQNGKDEVKILADRLGQAGVEERWKILVRLKALGPEAALAVPALLHALEDKTAADFSSILETLESVSRARVEVLLELVPSILEVLRSNDWLVRSQALKSLALTFEVAGRRSEAHFDKAASEVLKSLDDPEALVSHEAAECLVQLVPDPGVIPYEDLYNHPGKPRGFITRVWEWDRWTRNSFSEKAQIASVSLGSPDRRAMALWSLGKLGPRADFCVETLLTLLRKKEIKGPVSWALGNMGPSALEPIVALLDSPRRGEALAGALAAGTMGPKAREAVPGLRRLLMGLEGDEPWHSIVQNCIRQIQAQTKEPARDEIRAKNPESEEIDFLQTKYLSTGLRMIHSENPTELENAARFLIKLGEPGQKLFERFASHADADSKVRILDFYSRQGRDARPWVGSLHWLRGPSDHRIVRRYCSLLEELFPEMKGLALRVYEMRARREEKMKSRPQDIFRDPTFFDEFRIHRLAGALMDQLLASLDPNLRQAYLLILADLGHEAAWVAPELLDRYENANLGPEERAETLSCLAWLTYPISYAPSQIGGRVGDLLILMASGAEPWISWRAAEFQNWGGGHDVSKAQSLATLAAVLSQEAPDIPSLLSAIRGMGQWGSLARMEAPLITRWLNHADPAIQRKAAVALGKLSTEDKKVWHSLSLLLASENEDTASEAQWALDRIRASKKRKSPDFGSNRGRVVAQ